MSKHLHRILITLIALLLSSCSGEQKRESENLSLRLKYHGFHDPSKVKRVIKILNSAAAKDDIDILVHAVHFPLTLHDTGEVTNIFEDKAALGMAFKTVFTDTVLNALKTAEYNDLFINDQGAMIGDGEVWLYQYPEGIKIKAINP